MIKILFVCTGNICRSPSAEAIFRHKIKNLKLENKFYCDSVGIESFHVGEYPDSRAIAVGLKNGVSFANITARQITKDDFEEFDYLLVMDKSHYRQLISLSPDHLNKIKLFLEFCNLEQESGFEVEDPYYHDEILFKKTFDTIDLAIDKLIENLSKLCL